jgi:hypothetical protein
MPVDAAESAGPDADDRAADMRDYTVSDDFVQLLRVGEWPHRVAVISARSICSIGHDSRRRITWLD